MCRPFYQNALGSHQLTPHHHSMGFCTLAKHSDQYIAHHLLIAFLMPLPSPIDLIVTGTRQKTATVANHDPYLPTFIYIFCCARAPLDQPN
jgi:hypothetical protein